MKKEENIKFKILLIGPSGIPFEIVGVGKTSLLLKYVHNKFSYDYQVTTGIEFFTKEVPINEKTAINLQIWDTVTPTLDRWDRKHSSQL
jgi:GTPase SAR1 family protein